MSKYPAPGPQSAHEKKGPFGTSGIGEVRMNLFLVPGSLSGICGVCLLSEASGNCYLFLNLFYFYYSPHVHLIVHQVSMT